jgi:hypothetical protein
MLEDLSFPWGSGNPVDGSILGPAQVSRLHTCGLGG